MIKVLTKEAKKEGLELEDKFILDAEKTFIATLAIFSMGGTLEKAMIKQVINYKINGLTFKDRLIRKNLKLVAPIQNKIKEGLNQGKSYDEIALTLKPIFDMSDRHSKLIAQTEGHRIIEATREIAYENASRETKFDVYWTSAMDRKVRQQHMELEGQKRGEDGYFEVDGFKSKYPGGFGKPYLDCRCRCSTYIMLK